MNIFNVLSQGKSRLHEPSISAVLGYLLSPNGDHGLGDTFLKSFLKLCNSNIENDELLNNIINQDFIDAEVNLEVQYTYNDQRNDIDIQLGIIDKSTSDSK